MYNYFDNNHIDGKQLTPQQIADAIRHKKFGIDVREAMAQGLEYCMEQAQKVDKLEQDLSNLDKRVTSLETLPNEVAEIEQDLSNLDKRVTSLETLPSEVAEIKQDIGTINKDIETIENQITKLNLAVFGDGAVPIDTPIDSNNQTNKAQEVHLD